MTPHDQDRFRRERLTFNYGAGSVPSRQLVEAAIRADDKPTFATSRDAEEPRDWGYAGLLLFTAVLLFRPQESLPGLGSMHIAEICAVLGILPMLLHRFAHRLPVFRITPETLGLAAFGAVIVGTAPFSIWPGGALMTFFDSYLKILIVFVLMMNTLTSAKRIEQLTWLILLACGYIAARAGYDYMRGMNLTEGSRVSGAVSGMWGNPNDLALNMVTFLPAAAVVIMNRRASAFRRVAAVGIVALMLMAIAFTKSRGGFVGLAVMIASLAFLGRKVRPGFGIAVIVGVLVAVPLMPASFWDRMSTIFDEQQDKAEYTGSSEARRVVMQEGISAFLEFPLTGVGAGQFKNYNPPGRQERWRETHDVLIQVAAETGIFGLIAFAFLIVRGGVAAAWTRRRLASPRRRGAPDPLQYVMTQEDRESLYAHTVAMTAGLIGWFVCAFFASVAYGWTFYYLLALIVAARELTAARIRVATELERRMAKGRSVPLAHKSREVETGAA